MDDQEAEQVHYAIDHGRSDDGEADDLSRWYQPRACEPSGWGLVADVAAAPGTRHRMSGVRAGPPGPDEGGAEYHRQPDRPHRYEHESHDDPPCLPKPRPVTHILKYE